MMKTFNSHSLEETAHIAKEWLKETKAQKKSDEAYVVGLRGHLGAGKTAFVKAVAKVLGIKDEVTSPTFVIMKVYEVQGAREKGASEKGANWRRLIHIDAYRLERREELEALRFEDILADPNNLVMIEWPENVGLAGTEIGNENKTDLDAELAFEIRDNVHMITMYGK